MFGEADNREPPRARRFIGLYLLYSFLGLYFENILPDALVGRSDHVSNAIIKRIVL